VYVVLCLIISLDVLLDYYYFLVVLVLKCLLQATGELLSGTMPVIVLNGHKYSL